jgi:multidrug resistance efflux pump
MPLPLRSREPRELRLPTLDEQVLHGDRFARRAVTMTVLVLALVAATAAIVASLVSVDVSVDGVGALEPLRVWPVRALEQGTIDSVFVRAGDSVRVGEPLLRLDSLALEDSRTQLQTQRRDKELDRDRAAATLPLQVAQQTEAATQANARLVHARAVLRQQMTENGINGSVDSLLSNHRPGSHVALDLAVSDVRAAESEYRAADEARQQLLLQHIDLDRQDADVQGLAANIATLSARIRRLVVRAPASGVVLTESLEQLPGMLVHPGDEILEIADPSDWRAVVSVSEHDVHDVHVGDSASLDVPALERFNGGKLGAHVVTAALEPGTGAPRLGAAEASPATGAYRIVLAIDEPELRAIGLTNLRRGYSVTAKVITRRGRILRLLKDYVMHRGQ